MSNALFVREIAESIVIQFNRPEIRSPLSIFVLEELSAVLDKIDKKAAIGKIIFTGKDDIFASGADLREIAKLNGEKAHEFSLRGQNLMNKIASLKQTTIAAVNGICFGGALDLALACDFRIAAPAAEFAHPGANLGIITGWGGTQRLPRLIGEAKALEMFLLAKRVGASEALSIGLIDRIAENPLAFSLANYQTETPS